MISWNELTDNRKTEILIQTSQQSGLPAQAIEKDWWVTIMLKAVFNTEWNKLLVFKGGTSLSKSWNLIQRFSEDIDLAIDRSVFGVGNDDDLSNSQIKTIRKKSCRFVSEPFLQALKQQFDALKVPDGSYELKAAEVIDSDQDPQLIYCQYKSVLKSPVSSYIPDQVILEVGSRSLIEPSSQREIVSILDSSAAGKLYAGNSFTVQTVEPKRTFLEKAFLLHEEFQKPENKIQYARKSRHLYDLERLMDTEHGLEALRDIDLYKAIVKHREKFNLIKMDYNTHAPATIDFIPRESFSNLWKQDYRTMTENMIYGETLSFEALIDRLLLLKERFRQMRHIF